MKISDRTERLLALLLLEQMKGAYQRDKAARLNLAGFSNVEIADILQITSAQVARDLYDARQAPAKKKLPAKKPPNPGKTQEH